MLTIMWVCMSDGTKVRRKFLGPATLKQWLVCWAVYACGMIMHGLAFREAMDDYRDFICELHETWGAKCWAIIYQADVRMRRNGLEYIRRQAHYLLEAAVAHESSGQRLFVPRNPYEFDGKNLWDYCYRKAINAECPTAIKYWKKNVEQPCNFVMNRGDKVCDHVQTDAEICAHPEDHIATGGEVYSIDNRPTPRQGGGQPTKIKPEPAIKKENGKGQDKFKKDKNCYYTHNMKGNKICMAFNIGKCTGRCEKNESHQCNVCLNNSHTGTWCGQKDSAPTGKAGGKKKGKKG